METVAATQELIDLTCTDWEHTRRAELNGIARDATIGEVASEAVQLMGLSLKGFYETVFKGKELNHSDTIEEAGVETNDELEIVPAVSAG
jgi:hypothetical protein